MYESFYGLKENAFSLTPDPYFLFLNARGKEALDRILYCIERREGFSVIAGDIGTGKTTMCWALLERLAEKNIRTAIIQNPMLSEIEILKTILQDLGVRPELAAKEAEAQNVPQQLFDVNWMNGLSKKQLLDLLNGFLVERAQEEAFTVLIVDEAQNLPLMLMEQLRLLSNLETSKKKLLQIIFIGQTQLIQKLKSDSLRQLDQRVSFRFETKPLSPEDSKQYIRHRLNIAGSPDGAQFSDSAFRAIWRHSKGYPRLINLICDRALLAGYKEQTKSITPRLVRRAVMDLRGIEANGVRLFARERFRKAVPYIIPIAVVVFMLVLIAYISLAYAMPQSKVAQSLEHIKSFLINLWLLVRRSISRTY
jgi:general secretion pathway protein A